MEAPITISYRWSLDEVLLVNHVNMQYGAHGGRIRTKVRNGGILFLILGTLLLLGAALAKDKLGNLTGGTICILVGGFLVFGFQHLINKAAKKAYEKRADRDLIVTYTASETGLSSKSEINSSQMAWKVFVRAQNPVEVEPFAALVKSKVGDYKDATHGNSLD
jgi:hypothetical protein